MSDYRITWQFFNGDWVDLPPGLDLDDSLLTAVIISLFTDRRAEEGDELPDGSDPRGWWGDGFAEDGDKIGSRLWLLSRSKMLPETLARAKTYAEEALSWLLTDNVARRVDIVTEAVSRDTLGIGIDIVLLDGTAQTYRFQGGLNGL